MAKKVESMVNDEPAEGFTSMIDIVFLLLIFFILQPFKAPEMKLKSELPKDSGAAAPTTQSPRDPITLSVRRNPGAGKGAAIYWVNQRRLGRNGGKIWEELLREARGDQTVPVALQADSGVYFQYVLTALDQCYKAEMKDVKFTAP